MLLFYVYFPQISSLKGMLFIKKNSQSLLSLEMFWKFFRNFFHMIPSNWIWCADILYISTRWLKKSESHHHFYCISSVCMLMCFSGVCLNPGLFEWASSCACLADCISARPSMFNPYYTSDWLLMFCLLLITCLIDSLTLSRLPFWLTDRFINWPLINVICVKIVFLTSRPQYY